MVAIVKLDVEGRLRECFDHTKELFLQGVSGPEPEPAAVRVRDSFHLHCAITMLLVAK